MFEPLIIAEETRAARQRNAVILAGVAIAWMGYAALSMMIMPWITDTLAKIYVSRCIIWLELPALYLYSSRVEAQTLLPWWTKPREFWFYILAVPAVFLSISCAGLVSSIPHLLGYHDDISVLKRYNELFRSRLFLSLFTCITAGITEEIAFRGYILPRLSAVFKSQFWGVIVSALLFAIMHFSYHSLTEAIFAFLFGIVTGCFYLRFRNLSVLMLCHFLYDFNVIFIAQRLIHRH